MKMINNKIEKEIKKLKFLAEDLMAIPYGSIDSKCRKKEYVMARIATAAFIIFEVGFSEEQAKKYIKRDRTSFYHYKKKHLDYMQSSKNFPTYFEFYNHLIDAYMRDSKRFFKTRKSFEFYVEIQKAKNEQKKISRRLRELDKEAKRIGL
jgi:hypothetical protein